MVLLPETVHVLDATRPETGRTQQYRLRICFGARLHQSQCILAACRPENCNDACNPLQTIRLQALELGMSQVLSQNPVRLSQRLKAVVLPRLALGLAAVFLLLLLAIFLLVVFWPFRLDTVIRELADESDSKVTAGSFQATYFPHPGCVLEKVIFQHNPRNGSPPLITVKRITIRGTFTGIFAKHVKMVLVEACTS